MSKPSLSTVPLFDFKLVIDRHRFNADLDPNFHFDANQIQIWICGIKTMLIHMRILPYVFYRCVREIRGKITFIHNNESLQCFSILINVLICTTFGSILKFPGTPDPGKGYRS
jgi:hypothetical protein